MGCSGAKEKLEDRMMLIKLARMEIQMEKEKELKKLSEMEGKQISRVGIPDYIDPEFAKQKNLYFVENDNQVERKVNTDIQISNKSKKNEKKKKDNLTELSEKKQKVKNSKIKGKASSDDIKKEKNQKQKDKKEKKSKSKNNTKSTKQSKKSLKADK